MDPSIPTETDINPPQIPNHHLSWLPSLPADAPIEDIRAAYERDGVVHIRGLLPRQEVLGVRRT
jgi:phytanoyl-CoA hydroxylase